MTPDEGLRPRVVLWSGAGMLVVCYALLRFFSSRGGNLPQNSWLTIAVIALVAMPILVLAWQIKSYVAGRTPEPPSPQLARGVLVAARASAVAGGVAFGWYAAQVLVRLPNADVASQREEMWLALVLAVVSVLLSVAGFVAQAWCRIPPEDDDEDRRSRGGGAATA